jgi:hypothetical protein
MIEQEVALDGVPTEIILFECSEDDIIERDNKLFVIDEDKKVIGELYVKSLDGLEERLKSHLKVYIKQNLDSGKLPVIVVHIYQYGKLFFIQFVIEDYAIELAKKTTKVIEQLLGDNDVGEM